MKRILKWLRSPVAGVSSVLAVAVYSIIGSTVPQRATSIEQVGQWTATHPSLAPFVVSLGLFSAFRSPIFLVLVAILMASLVACSWTRTRASLLALASRSDAAIPRVTADAADIVVTAPADELAAVASISDAVKSAGFRVREVDGRLHAEKAVWSVIGSPVFHWSLVALVVAIAMGQLTRSEGVLSIPIGQDTAYSAQTMTYSEAGPFHRWSEGVVFSAANLELSTVRGGVDRGVSADITARDAAGRTLTQRVYPNAPLRMGSLLVHPYSWGYSPVFSIETTDGQSLTSTRGIIDQKQASTRGAGPGSFDINGGPLDKAAISFFIPAESVDAQGRTTLAQAVEVSVRPSGETSSTPVRLALGERIPIGAGLWIRFAEKGQFVSLSIADDASVVFIYAFFALATIGLSIAVLVAPTRVWAAVSADDPLVVFLRVRGRRNDPVLAEKIADDLRKRLGEAFTVEQKGSDA